MKIFYKLNFGLFLITFLFTTNLFAQTLCEAGQPMVNGQQYTGSLADNSNFASFSFLVSANSTPGSTITITLSSNQDPLFQIERYLDGHCGSNLVYDYQGNISFGFSPTGVIPEFNSPLTLTVTPGQLYVLAIQNATDSFEDYSIQIDYNAAEITVEGPSTAPTTPDEFSHANLWYKADAGVTTGATFTWENQANPTAPTTPVTGDANVSQSTANNQPTYNNTSGAAQINFNPSITFDGTDDFLESSGAISNFLGVDGSGDKVASQFVVYKRLDSDVDGNHIYNIYDNGILFLGGKTNGRQLQESLRQDVLTSPILNETLILDLLATTSSTFASNQFSMDKNGIENQAASFAGNHVSGNSGVMRFGRYGSDYGNFVIAEVVVFPIRVSLSLRKEVQSYLAIKYGISLGDNNGLSLYYNSAGLAVYVSNTYNHDVFGIAKDDGAGLNQTQSNSMNTGSGDGTGQSGKGNIVLSNPSSLEDGDYLLIGNNGAALTYSNTGSNLHSDFSNYQRVARQWYISEKNEVGTITLEFEMDGLTSVISSTASDFALLYDTDDDLSNVGSANKIDASSISGTKITFTNLNLANGNRITFLAKTAALPVELTSFTAANLENKVVLNWATATEVNNYGFEVERQILKQVQNDTESWVKVGFVEGNGNSNSPKQYTFEDNSAQNGTYSYRLKQIDFDGKFEYSNVVELEVNTLPTEFALEQNYPNPFNPTTTIKYAIPTVKTGAPSLQTNVLLKVYDVLGNEVATLVNEQQSAGNYEVKFNASNLTSGIYLYRIQSGSFIQTKKLMLIK